MPSDTDILNASTSSDKDDSGDENLEDDSIANSVSSADALHSLDNLSDFYDSNGVNEQFFYHLSQMKNIVNDFHMKKITAPKQTLIFHYSAK